MGIGDVWDFIKDKFSEGLEEFKGLFSGMFSNLNEFSIPGLVAGGLMVFLLFLARNMILTPFLKLMPVGQKVLMTIVCYVAVFFVGYLMMKAAFEK